MNKEKFEHAIKLPVTINGNNDPLLMIHGIISGADFFLNISEFLKDEFQVVTYDRRGYGLSCLSVRKDMSAAGDECDNKEISDYTVSSQAEDAAKVISDNDKGPAWVFGNSAGGLIAIELALKYPELVKGLILMEPSLCFDEESKQLITEWNRELNGYVESKKIKKALPAFSRVIGNANENKESVSLAEMKKTYKNLSNFMYGELNEVQSYRPEKSTVENINIPVVVYVTEDGQNSIFGKTSMSGAAALNWKTEMIPGYHNTVKENPAEIAECIKKTIFEMRKTIGEKCKI